MGATTYAPASTTAWDTSDRIFTIGNGDGGVTTHNAFTMWKSGSFAFNDDDFNFSSGEENKFFFDYTTQAIRMGSVAGTEWDSGNTGVRSIGIGFADPNTGAGAIASASDSIAIGGAALATNNFTVAIGTLAQAIGFGSTAISAGDDNVPVIASGAGALALGYAATASGEESIALGGTASAQHAFAAFGNASGPSSFAFGGSASGDSATSFRGIASGNSSIAFDGTASGSHSVSFGFGESFSSEEFNIGDSTSYSPVGTSSFEVEDRMFTVGLQNHDALTILKSGLTGIGIDNFEATTNPELLQVGTSGISGAVARFTNSSGSCIINPTTSSVGCTSDIRLKKNITSISSSLDHILSLRPVTYNWLNETTGTQTHDGLIAQELELIYPDLVSTDTNGYKTVAYTALTPYMIRAIQELNLKVTNLTDFTQPDNSLVASLRSWLASATNGIGDFVAGRVRTNELCVGETCLNEAQVKAIIEATNAPSGNGGSGTQLDGGGTTGSGGTDTSGGGTTDGGDTSGGSGTTDNGTGVGDTPPIEGDTMGGNVSGSE
jgi:hypothetical protein